MNISTFSQSKQKNNAAEKYKIVAKTDKKISNKKAFYILFVTEEIDSVVLIIKVH